MSVPATRATKKPARCRRSGGVAERPRLVNDPTYAWRVECVRARLVEAEVTQREMAARIGVGENHVYNVLRLDTAVSSRSTGSSASWTASSARAGRQRSPAMSSGRAVRARAAAQFVRSRWVTHARCRAGRIEIALAQDGGMRRCGFVLLPVAVVSDAYCAALDLRGQAWDDTRCGEAPL